jgi:hypothetical protein
MTTKQLQNELRAGLLQVRVIEQYCFDVPTTFFDEVGYELPWHAFNKKVGSPEILVIKVNCLKDIEVWGESYEKWLNQRGQKQAIG